jgi:hypothetical protein
LISCGIIVVIYALFVYYRRLKLLESGKSYGYVDRIGPAFLGVSVAIGLILFLFHSIDLPSYTSNFIVLQAQTGFCWKHSLDGLSRLQFEPSDVVVDAERKLILVPSSSTITGIAFAGLTETGEFVAIDPPKDLINIPGADLEAMTYAGDTVYALSEGSVDERGNPPTIYALQWDSHELRIVDQWDIPRTSFVEAIVFVPDKQGGPGKLLVGGEQNIWSFDLPAAMGGSQLLTNRTHTLKPTDSRWNRKIYSFGLEDSKIGSLCYFEGVLYVLFDNGRVIRGWDLDTGKILSQIKLPQVGNGFDKQWEGMALQRIERTQRNKRLGRSLVQSTSDLILHLTLDTPGQVWSFVVENSISGEVVLPDCAGASWADKSVPDFPSVAAVVNQ